MLRKARRLITRHKINTGLKVSSNPDETFKWFVLDILFTKKIFSFIFPAPPLLVYETMFAKREDWQGLQRSDLLKFFNDCGHYPTQQHTDQVCDLILWGE